MAGLTLFTGNRLETLIRLLGDRVEADPGPPLRQEVVVVQSKGMERWISMRLAERFGVWANGRFPFPNTLIGELFRELLPGLPENRGFRPENLRWHIMQLLPQLLETEEFESLRSYLDSGPKDLKLFQVAGRIADIYDQYLVYRPDMIDAWEGGADRDWQAVLWRTLSSSLGPHHRASLKSRLVAALGDGSVDPGRLPPRLSVFGVSTLPPYHLDVVVSMSNLCETNLFLMNPTQEFWADITSAKEIARRTVRDGRMYTPEELHLESANSLLASMGGMGRDFFRMIGESDIEPEEHFLEPDQSTLLSRLQWDILHLTERRTDGAVAPNDLSVRVHSCHTPMREVEVLHDQLLALLDEIPGLQPEDILVMAPDIDVYTSFIHAELADSELPYNISDRSPTRDNSLIEAFLSVLGLPEDRFALPRIIELLECEPVHRRLGLDEERLRLVRDWLVDTRVRWGIDARDKAELDLPEEEQNTWRAGIARLLLGYSMAEQTLISGILPYGDIEGREHSEVLGIVVPFLHSLFHFGRDFRREKTLDGWSELLQEVLLRLFDPAAEGRKMLPIQSALDRLRRVGEQTGYDRPVGLRVIRSYLRTILAEPDPHMGFLSGGVTFGSLLPMRAIPFRVICLLGMNEQAFPRTTQILDFDRIAAGPARLGDRSRNLDDRYLFLETLLSAREVFSMSYVGQDIRDNSEMAPSVLVSELLDYIDSNHRLGGVEDDGGAALSGQLVWKHPLQAFSPRYFDPRGPLFSYSEDDFEASRALAAGEAAEHGGTVPGGFFVHSLPDPDPELRSLTLDQLCRFYRHPVRYLLHRRLSLLLNAENLEIDARESFRLSHLERFRVEQELVERLLEGWDPAEVFPLMKARGILPPGRGAEVAFDEAAADAASFVRRYRSLEKGVAPEPVELDLRIGGFRLIGSVELWEHGLFPYRSGKLRPEDAVDAWIRHIACSIRPAHIVTRFLTRDTLLTLRPVQEARARLGTLLEWYWRGLARPLPLFPRTSLTYVERLEKGASERDALRAAAREWVGSEHSPREGEGADAYNFLVFGGSMPLAAGRGPSFDTVAREILGPLAAHGTKEKTI